MGGFLTPSPVWICTLHRESVEGVSDPLRRLEMVTSIVAVFSSYSPALEFGSRVRGGGFDRWGGGTNRSVVEVTTHS